MMSGHEHQGHEHQGYEHHEHAADHDHHDHAAEGGRGAPPQATRLETADHDHAGHGDHAAHDHSAHDPQRFRKLFWICLALTVPTLVFSTGLQEILGLTGPRFPGSEWIPAIFGTAIAVIGGRIFLQGAWHELRAKSPGMMTLISLAIVVSFGYSVAVMFGLPGMDFWWELATLITIMLLGHWIEMSAVLGAQNALGELAKLLPDEAEVLRDGEPVRVASAELVVGDEVLVRPGSAIPADGEVVDGAGQVDESLLTGESTPVDKAIGDAVVAGSIASGSFTVRVTRTGGDTALAGIMKLVAEAQASRSPAQLLADRAAALLFYVALGAALITLVAWWLLLPDDPAFVIERVVAVLVIACPHALGLAIPLVAQLSTAIGAKNGLLVRSRAALEDARNIEVVLFDKTGTLTEGKQGVSAVIPSDGQDGDVVLALAAAVESSSEHPIARAIVAAGGPANATRSTDFESLAGRGASATVDSRRITVASRRVVAERSLTIDPGLESAGDRASAQGQTVVYVLDETSVLGLVALADVIRPESPEAVAELHKAGVRVAMLTGDSRAVGDWVAARLGITEVFAEVLPGEKSAVVAKLQKDGTRVAMVGDGVNDAPALAQADVGIAIGAGTDVAIESAGIVLASSDPRGVLAAFRLSKATYRKMQQNLWWGAGYNVIGIPLAAGALFGAGVLLSPAVGAIFMSVSTIVVALNAQLLRRVKL